MKRIQKLSFKKKSGEFRFTLLPSILLTMVSVLFLPPEARSATLFRGCFASGPDTDGTVDSNWDADVDTITNALIGTGSWQAGNITELKNGNRASITNCLNNAKTKSVPGDEFVFFFSGHGGSNSLTPDTSEVGESLSSDNHILIGDTTPGTRDYMTDDQLADLLSGFKQSVTMSVVLDSCYSHGFSDGADDLGSVTQVNGTPQPAGDHIALVSSTTSEKPTCGIGFTDKLAEGLMKMNGMFKADTDKDGVVTTEEFGDYAQNYVATENPKCTDQSCPIPDEPESSYFGVNGCDPFSDEVCTQIGQTVPEPSSTMPLIAFGLLGTASTLKHKQKPSKSTEKELEKV